MKEINNTLERINERMRQAARTESARISAAAAAAAAAAAESDRNKRVSSVTPDGKDAKRIRLEADASAGPSSRVIGTLAENGAGGGTVAVSNALANFNFADLPASLVTDLIIANLQHFPEVTLTAAIAVGYFIWIHCHLIST
jgi:symplekin